MLRIVGAAAGFTAVFLCLLLLWTLRRLWLRRRFARLLLPSVPVVATGHVHQRSPLAYSRWGELAGTSPWFLVQAPLFSFEEPAFTLYVNDAAAAKQVLAHSSQKGLGHALSESITLAEGADWANLRRVIAPALTRSAVSRLEPGLSFCARMLLQHLAGLRGQVELDELFGRYSLDSFGVLALGLRSSTSFNPVRLLLERKML
jgi:cytochrome P450